MGDITLYYTAKTVAETIKSLEADDARIQTGKVKGVRYDSLEIRTIVAHLKESQSTLEKLKRLQHRVSDTDTSMWTQPETRIAHAVDEPIAVPVPVPVAQCADSSRAAPRIEQPTPLLLCGHPCAEFNWSGTNLENWDKPQLKRSSNTELVVSTKRRRSEFYSG